MKKNMNAEQLLDDYLVRIKSLELRPTEALDHLIVLFQYVRPPKSKQTVYAETQIYRLTQRLQSDELALTALQNIVRQVFSTANMSEILLESGIPSEGRFFAEFNQKISRKILPKLTEKGSFLYAIDSVFYKSDDYKWITQVDPYYWINLLKLLNLHVSTSTPQRAQQFVYALHLISCQIASLAGDYTIAKRMKDEALKSFLIQNDICIQLLPILQSQELTSNQFTDLKKELIQHLKICKAQLQGIIDLRSEKGSSVQMSYSINRTQKQIDRMQLILELISNEQKDVEAMHAYLQLIITNENTKNSIIKFLKDHIQELAYQVSEHGHHTGEHYITLDKAAYFSMLVSAMWGGFVIAIVAVFKCLLHTLHLAPFWQAFSYGLNYASGFVLIHATGATLATKQPAMTASTIAGSIDTKRPDRQSSTAELAILISQVWRSQTASFVGNLGVVFPVALCMAYLWSWLFGHNLTDPSTSLEILHSNNPWKSLSILYACHTGVLLYLAGILSGYFDNLVIFSNIPQRLREHPMLKRRLSNSFAEKAITYFTNNVGLIMGNIILGFMLAFTSFFGDIFGFSFDVRHITLSTGNFAIALQGLGFDIAWTEVLATTIGILLIGFFNFAISFGLAFATALISRKIKFKQYRQFTVNLRRLLFKYPIDFVWPPKEVRTPKDFLN